MIDMRIQLELLCNIYSNSMVRKSWENAIPHQIIPYLQLKLSIRKQFLPFYEKLVDYLKY